MIVNNKYQVSFDIRKVIVLLQNETSGKYFKTVLDKGDELMCSCPFHKDGQENHPSFSIHQIEDEYHGVYHCFTCGVSGNILDLISYCLSIPLYDAQQWLIDRFDTQLIYKQVYLPEISFDDYELPRYLDNTVLDQYRYYNDYMFKRGLTKEIIKEFSIGSTPDGMYVTFPCWDEHNNLVGIFKRSTVGKQFIIPTNIDKPIYLLNFILNKHITQVVVCESQFNALSCWVWGYPAICLFGTGTQHQYDILKRSGIRSYMLAFDGDDAGDKGRERFIKNMPDDVFISSKVLPRGKDVNDLTKDEFDNLPLI